MLLIRNGDRDRKGVDSGKARRQHGKGGGAGREIEKELQTLTRVPVCMTFMVCCTWHQSGRDLTKGVRTHDIGLGKPELYHVPTQQHAPHSDPQRA